MVGRRLAAQSGGATHPKALSSLKLSSSYSCFREVTLSTSETPQRLATCPRASLLALQWAINLISDHFDLASRKTPSPGFSFTKESHNLHLYEDEGPSGHKETFCIHWQMENLEKNYALKSNKKPVSPFKSWPSSYFPCDL